MTGKKYWTHEEREGGSKQRVVSRPSQANCCKAFWWHWVQTPLSFWMYIWMCIYMYACTYILICTYSIAWPTGQVHIYESYFLPLQSPPLQPGMNLPGHVEPCQSNSSPCAACLSLPLRALFTCVCVGDGCSPAVRAPHHHHVDPRPLALLLGSDSSLRKPGWMEEIKTARK